MRSHYLSMIRRHLPAACIVCGQVAERDHGLCLDCELQLPKQGLCCRRCGVAVGSAITHDGICNACQVSPPHFDSCTAALPYSSPVDRLVAEFKFSARFDIGYTLSRILASAFIARYSDEGKPQILLPVPLHRSRLRARGYNQAEEICKVLARHCEVDTSNSALAKTRNTAAQTAVKSSVARKSNLSGAFSLGQLDRLENVTHIALVDDVVTTMATSDTLAKLLKRQLECRIDVWCLARANR